MDRLIAMSRAYASRLRRRFIRSDRGAVAPLIGISTLVLIGCVGIAVDVGRSGLVKARLVDALDAAGLAVGARIGTPDFTAEAIRYVNANFKANYASATVTNVVATANDSKTVISLTATATMPTSFMRLFGQTDVTVTARSEVTRETNGLEVVLALDNTGSMAGSIGSLKNAANSLVNTLFGADTVATNLFIGLVPFSDIVNVGTTRTNWVNFTNSTQSAWKGCLMERGGGLDQTDDAPTGANKFADYYWPAPDSSYPKRGTASASSSRNCPAAVVPMTNVKSTVTTGIGTMTAAGNTHINIGAVWAWRMISPTWKSLWGSPSWEGKALPLDYGTDKMSKAVVLMTDGDNTMSADTFTAYNWLDQGVLGTTNAGTAESTLDTRLKTVCTRMKAKGITIYTVAFNNPGSATKSLLQSCATGTSYYFDAGNSAALTSAFQTIAGSLSNLRVSR